MQNKLEELSLRLEVLLAQMPQEGRPVTVMAIMTGWFFGFFEEYTQWRYEHPYLSKFLAIFRFLLFSILFVVLIWWMAGTAAGRLTGLESVRDRAVFGYYSVVWASKGVPTVDSLPFQPKRFSGTIEKVVDDVLIISYYDKGRSVRRLVRPANVILLDKQGFAAWANQYILKGVTIDFYMPIDKVSGHDVWGVVLWSQRVPINVQLVELGYAIPEENPKTQVVNQVFSQYYFQRARSG